MDRHAETMLADRKAALNQAGLIIAKGKSRDLTEEELAKVETLSAKAEQLQTDIEEYESDWLNRGQTPLSRGPGRPGPIGDGLSSPSFLDRAAHRPANGCRFDTLFGNVSSSSQFRGLGDFLAAVGNAPQHHDNRLTPAATAFAGMVEGLDSQGGFAVPVEYAREIISGVLEKSFMLSNCDVRPMKSNELRVPAFDDSDHSAGLLFGGISATWAEEGSSPDASTPKLRQLALHAKKLFILCQVSSELLADAENMEAELGRALGDAGAFFIDDACISSGTGAGQPLSVLGSPGVIEVAAEAGQANATITYENLAAMVGKLSPSCFANSQWLGNPTCIAQLLKLVIPVENAEGAIVGGSHYPALTESNGQYRLLGRPVTLTEKCKTLGTVGDIILLDPKQYVAGLRKEISIDRSNHVGFLSDTVYFRMIVRIDGMSKWSSAVTMKNGGTVGWAVTLESREGS